MRERVMLSRSLAMSMLSNRDFLSKFPEFGGIRTGNSNVLRGGCSGCRRRRNEVNAMNSFLSALRALPPARMAAFKQYLNAGNVVYQTNEQGSYKTGAL